MNELKHIAFICDGNGRWAKNQGKPRTYGHDFGSEVVKDITMHIVDNYDVEAISFYIFSTENWNRPKGEVSVIIQLLNSKLKKWAKLFVENNVQLKFIGSRDGLDPKLIKLFDKYEKITSECTGTIVNLCFNYGSRKELIEATKRIIDDNITSEEITEELFSKYLYTYPQPDVDLLVRTSGEQRISNYLLWQIAYSELFFTDTLWPDMNASKVDEIIGDYINRNRRFGGLNE